MSRPNLFIAAAPRSGTTSLYSLLGQHPDIVMSSRKEPAFYHFQVAQPDFDSLARTYGQHYHAESIRRYRRARRQAVLDLGTYQRLWPDSPARICGEATPTYVYHEAALRLIRQEAPAAKLVLLLRNPLERAYSQYLQYLRHGIESVYDFDEALALEPIEVDNYWWGERRYLRLGLYAQPVERTLNLFDTDNVLVILREDFHSDPQATVARVFEFLQLRPFTELDTDLRHNVGFVPRPTPAVRAARSDGRTKRALRRLVPAPLRRSLYHRIMEREPMTPPPFHGTTRARLLDFYRDDIRRLEQLIGRDLRIWLGT